MNVPSFFIKHFSFPLISWNDGLSGVIRQVKRLETSQYWSPERLKNYQRQRLKRLLIHAYESTVFYKKRFDDAGFDPYRFDHTDQLRTIPYLTKEQIRDDPEGLISRKFSQKQLHASETGGTTGVKMKFYRDNNCLPFKEAGLYRFEKWTGWDFGERIGIVWPAMSDYVGFRTWRAQLKNSFASRQIVLPGAVLDTKSLADYVNLLQKKKPSIIRAFPSPLYELANYLMETGIDDIRLKGITTTGEPLYHWQRKRISQAFHCEIFDSYRSRETGPIAQECEQHAGMHINAESLYLEIKNDAAPGSLSGEIVITDLLNYGMPFVRYRMGDLGALHPGLCSCGRSLPLLEKVEGRAGDALVAQDRKKIQSGALVLYLVDKAPGLVGQMQIIQDEPRHLRILMTNNPLPTQEIVDYQKGTLKKLFGENIRVTYEFVERIPREDSGKYLFTKCLVSNPIYE